MSQQDVARENAQNRFCVRRYSRMEKKTRVPGKKYFSLVNNFFRNLYLDKVILCDVVCEFFLKYCVTSVYLYYSL